MKSQSNLARRLFPLVLLAVLAYVLSATGATGPANKQAATRGAATRR
jgi:hypothetical protein